MGVTLFSYASNWTPSIDLNFRCGLSNHKEVLSQQLSWDHSYVNVVGKVNEDSIGVFRWAFPDTTSLNIRPTDLFYEAYFQKWESKIGKHHAPFGSYKTRTISDVWTRSFEEVNRIGVSSRLVYTDAFAVDFGAFNNGVNDALSCFSVKTEIVPRPEIVFQQSLLYDQVFDANGLRSDKIDIHAMSLLNFKGSLVDIDLYRQLAGPNKNATALNIGVDIPLSQPLDLAVRLEWANAGASALINRNIGLTLGLNNKVTPTTTYSIEAQFMTLQDSQFTWTLQNRLSVNL